MPHHRIPEVTGGPSTLLVTDRADLDAALSGVDRPVVGVDVERSDADRYHRSPALVQLGADGRCVLVDPLALDDLGALDAFLTGRLAVFHAVSNDLVPLDSRGVRPDPIADTAVAAALLGLPQGLERLLAEVLGIDLGDDKERYQRADWEARPLPDDLLAYAAGDVVHLPALWHELAARLDAAGRRTWYEQELAATVAHTRADTRAWWRTRGADGLDGQQRAVLRSVWEEREAIARAHDLAPNHLLHDRVLVGIARDPPGTPAALVRQARASSAAADHAERLFGALARGQRTAPEPPAPAAAWGDAEQAAARAMRRARAGVARDLDIDPGVLCPSRSIAAAVAAAPHDADELCAAAGLRPWQRDLLAAVLWDAYTRHLP